MSVVERYVSRHEEQKSAATNSAGKDDTKLFSTESQSTLFLNPSLGITEKEQFTNSMTLQ